MNTPDSQTRSPYFFIRFFQWLFSWSIARKLLISLAGLATLVALFYAVENWRGKHAWQKYRQQLEAKGEKFDLLAVAPPVIPDDQNFAATPMWQALFHYEWDPATKRNQWKGVKEASSNYFRLYKENDHSMPSQGAWFRQQRTKLENWQTYYRQTNRFGAYEFPFPDKPQTPAADVLFALSGSEPALNALREAASRPFSRFPVHYEDGFAAVLPHLGKLKAASQVLQMRTVSELEINQTDKALDDVCLSFRSIESLRNEPLLISHLVRIAMTTIALQPVWEGLADHKWSEAQLVSLDKELGKMDYVADCKSALRGERACQVFTLEFLRRTRDASLLGMDNKNEDESSARRLQSLGIWLMPSGWFYQNELACARFSTEWIESIEAAHGVLSPAIVSQNEDRQSKMWSRRNPYNVFAGMVAPGVSRCVTKFAQAQTWVDLAQIACNLERYKIANGQYPDNLNALVPKYAAHLPNDVINGQPLKYRRTDDGCFVLYSVGWNQTDDGGKIALGKGKEPRQDFKEGDWVWSYSEAR